MFPLIEVTGDALEVMTLTRQEVRSLVDTFLAEVGGFEPLYVEEMRGIAEGAGVDPTPR